MGDGGTVSLALGKGWWGYCDEGQMGRVDDESAMEFWFMLIASGYVDSSRRYLSSVMLGPVLGMLNPTGKHILQEISVFHACFPIQLFILIIVCYIF